MSLDELEQVVSRSDQSSLDTARYLHEHAYQRIVWYRSELWRISTLLWTAFAGFLVAAWQAASVLKSRHGLVAVAVFSLGSLTVWFYERYLRTIFPAIEYCNQLTQKREIELCRIAELETLDGFRTQDCNYGIWRATKPPLQFLFTFISMLVLAMVSLGIAISG
ncbi:hypothetical protein [Microcoleus sp.]|uniref:hypothetical protein n=1 Tax=Microcoleus sp. TaxID=44472 RepID=UPI00403E6F67